MTSKERLRALIERKPIDRVPIWMLFPLERISYALNILDEPSYQNTIKMIHEKTDFIERRSFPNRLCLNAHPEVITEQDGGVTRYKYKDTVLESRCYRDSSGKICVEPMVSEAEDLEKILSMPYEPDFSGIDLESERAFISRIGDRGIHCVIFEDPVSILHGLCDECGFCVICYSEEEAVTRFLDEMSRRCLERCRYLLENGIGEVFWIGGSEFVTPPMMSPAHFAKYVTPYTKALVDLIHSYGKKVMIHCHGRVKDVLHELKKIGADMLHPIEAPPMGDCTLSEAREVLGDDVIFVGNLQVGDLSSLSAEEITEKVKSALAQEKDHPFILAMTASPIHKQIDERIEENYRAIIESALKYGVKQHPVN